MVAGASGMERPRFLTWSLVGALLWVLSITLAGYSRATRFPWLARHIDYVILGLLALTVIPVGIHWWRERGSDREKSPAGTELTERPPQRKNGGRPGWSRRTVGSPQSPARLAAA